MMVDKYIDIRKIIKTKEYDFLRNNEHLGNNVCLLGLSGSYAYGTNIECSDIDIRGITMLRPEELFSRTEFEQYVDENTDTVIYSFNKFIYLLTNCNPNTIELLGLKDEQYLYMNDLGKALLDNKDLFLSKRAADSFNEYAYAQLRRLDNKSARKLTQKEQEEHILHSIENAKHSFHDKYFDFPEDAINLYIDKAVQKGLTTEIFMDINLHHYPLRDYKNMWVEMHNIIKEYAKIGKRNLHAIEHNKLGKHMMHLVRLYYMGIDILRDGKINTYREKEHDLLMDIRNGKYLDGTTPTNEFRNIVADLKARFENAKLHTELPDKPDKDKINKFLMDINQQSVMQQLNWHLDEEKEI